MARIRPNPFFLNFYDKSLKNVQVFGLVADVSSSHAVSQFVLVPDERHEAYIRLDLDVLIQHQDAVGLPRNWPQRMDLLGCIVELLTEFMNLWTRRK